MRLLLTHDGFSNEAVLFVTFQIVVHREGFAVEYGVGVLGYPVAEYEHTAGVAEHQVQFNVAVTEYEVVDVGM